MLEILIDSWSLVALVLCAFIVGWGAELGSSIMPQTLALSILAFLQSLPEFSVEGKIAWAGKTNLMIANFTGSLRLLTGLGLPMILFLSIFKQTLKKETIYKSIHLKTKDSLTIVFLGIASLYLIIPFIHHSISIIDSGILCVLYIIYIRFSLLEGIEPHYHATHTDHSTKALSPNKNKNYFLTTLYHQPFARYGFVLFLFFLGGLGLYFSIDPFIHTLEKWSLGLGISAFFFVQWVSPFLSEFPEKLTAFQWALQTKKAPLAVMNLISSNFSKATLLCAIIPIVYSISLGRAETIPLNGTHRIEFALTLSQLILCVFILLDLEFSILDGLLIFILWIVQFSNPDLRKPVMYLNCAWIVFELMLQLNKVRKSKSLPPALREMRLILKKIK